jgi:hypothetical protein
MYSLVFVTRVGSSVSSGYINTGIPSYDAAAKARSEEMTKMWKEGDRTTTLHLLEESRHECSVPGWSGACRQCVQKTEREAALKAEEERVLKLQRKLEKKGLRPKPGRGEQFEFVSPIKLLNEARDMGPGLERDRAVAKSIQLMPRLGGMAMVWGILPGPESKLHWWNR